MADDVFVLNPSEKEASRILQLLRDQPPGMVAIVNDGAVAIAKMRAENENLRSLVRDLVEVACEHQDEGPPDAGWKSSGLVNLINRAEAFLSEG